MALVLESLHLPLVTLDNGEVRVEGSRVPLQYLVYEYRQGATAEDIATRYPSLRLADIHAVLSYYLAHQAEVDQYVQQREALAQETRWQVEQKFPQQDLRAQLLARQSRKQ